MCTIRWVVNSANDAGDDAGDDDRNDGCKGGGGLTTCRDNLSGQQQPVRPNRLVVGPELSPEVINPLPPF